MKYFTRFGCFLLLGAVLQTSVCAADEKPAAAASPLAPLSSLVGGLWIGAVPGPKDRPPLTIELSFAWTENKQGIRFDSTFVRGGKRSPYTSGLYAWNGALKKLSIVYVDSSGSLTTGTITPEGDVLANELTVADTDGQVDQVRVRLVKDGTEVFNNEISIQKDGKWVPLVAVRYERRK